MSHPVSTGWCGRTPGSWGEAVTGHPLSPPLDKGCTCWFSSGITLISSEIQGRAKSIMPRAKLPFQNQGENDSFRFWSQAKYSNNYGLEVGVPKGFGGSLCKPCSFAWPLRNPHFWNILRSCSKQGSFRYLWRTFSQSCSCRIFFFFQKIIFFSRNFLRSLLRWLFCPPGKASRYYQTVVAESSLERS